MDAYQFPDFSFSVNLSASRYLEISPGRFIPLVVNAVSLWLSKRWYGMDQGDLWHEPWWNQSSNRWGSRPRDNLAPHTIFPWLKGPWLSFRHHSWLTGDFPCGCAGILFIRNYIQPCILLSMLGIWNLLLIFFFNALFQVSFQVLSVFPLKLLTLSVFCFHCSYTRQHLFLAEVTIISSQPIFLNFC